LVAAAKFLLAGTKKLFVVPHFVAVTKPFFFVGAFIELWSKRQRFDSLLVSLDEFQS